MKRVRDAVKRVQRVLGPGAKCDCLGDDPWCELCCPVTPTEEKFEDTDEVLEESVEEDE